MGRLERQCARIIEFLKERGNEGATSRELSEIALKYTSRISDLRDVGWRIHCTCENATRGIYRYHLLGRNASKRRELFDEKTNV